METTYFLKLGNMYIEDYSLGEARILLCFDSYNALRYNDTSDMSEAAVDDRDELNEFFGLNVRIAERES